MEALRYAAMHLAGNQLKVQLIGDKKEIDTSEDYEGDEWQRANTGRWGS